MGSSETVYKPHIPHNLIIKWQKIVDLMAKIIEVPVGLIMQVDADKLKVLVSSATRGNPFKKGRIRKLSTGLFCELVATQRAPLVVPDARKDPKWTNNPYIKLGMVAYLGYPLEWPNGRIFGTICVLDKKKNPFSATHKELIEQFKEIIEADIKRLLDVKMDDEPHEEPAGKSEFEKTLILGSISELVAYQDKELKVIWANRAACDSVGLSFEQLIGRHCYEIWQQRSEPCHGCPVVKALQIGEFQQAEITSTDDRIWLVRAYPVVETGGKMTGVVEITQEITERKRVEEKLRASEANYRAIFDAANDAIFVHNIATGDILDVNQKMCEMFGCSREEAGTLNVQTLSAGQEPFTQSNALRWIKKAADGEPQLFEWLSKDKNGRLFWTEVNLKRTVIGGNDRMLAVVRDISERKRAEEERQRLEAQIQYAQKLESLGVLAGGIAHDFNNLLTAIIGHAGLAQMKISPESPAWTCLEQIQVAGHRAAELTNQMLAYSGKGRFVVQTLNLSTLVQEMADLLKVSISKKINLRYELAADIPNIEADAGQIRQVAMNLITNASDAIGDSSGVIAVYTGVIKADRAYLAETYLGEGLPEGKYVYLEVSDTGVGMDDEAKAKIFDPFFTTKATGRGLGLAAVLGIVRGHRGTLKVYSEPGRGTSFKVLFPCSEQADETKEYEKQPTTEEWRGRGTILVVDDEKSVRSVVRKILETFGFTVLDVDNGRQALELFKEYAQEIVAVLLDLTMPDMNGDELFREMRRICPGVKAILSSGYNEQDTTNKFATEGLAGFIQKPYSPRTLLEKVREAIDGG